MPSSLRSSRRGVLVASTALLFTAAAAQADLIFFKDGYVIQGRTVREGERVFDNTTVVWVPKGFYYIDDDARRTYFSPVQVQDTAKKEFRIEGEFFKTNPALYPNSVQPIPPIGEILVATPWDDKWQREVKIRPAVDKDHPPARNILLVQQISMLSTHYVWVNSRNDQRYAWPVAYLTRELGPAVVRKLLHSHPSMKANPKDKPEDIAARRGRIVNFLILAGWYEDAEKELAELIAEYPDQKEKCTSDQELLKRLRTKESFEGIQRTVASGQHTLAAKQLANLPEDGLDDKLLTEARDLKNQYETARTNLEMTRRFLTELPRSIANPDLRTFFSEAGGALAAEVGYEEFLPPLRDAVKTRVGRLETFLTVARQSEAEQKAGQKVSRAPEHVLALAVSGWLLGNGSAEDKVETAQRLWQARQLALAYQKAEEPAERQKLLQDYERSGFSSVVTVEEMAQVITTLPPPDPDQRLPTDTIETEVVGKKKGPVYLLRLPPEYRHARPYGYPVLFVLHQGGEKAKDMIERWTELAGKYGFILVAPHWEQGARNFYSYTAEEQATVVEVLRDLKRRFQVDSDRVFLFGCGEGGNMAYDVGLSHPDLFAGVLPMSARPALFAGTYWTNAQYLPFYVVTGAHPGQNVREDTRDQFEKWIPRGYPGLWVVYRGRGLEWFGGELPMLCDWMSHKVRSNPVLEVGRTGGGLNAEFRSLRVSDNRFYWLSTRAIRDRHTTGAPPNFNGRVAPATLQARISTGNFLNIHAEGVNEVTTWFGRGSTIDFDKPITVYVGLKKTTVKVKPSLGVLLEDLQQRGDKQRPFWARLDFPL